MLLKQLKILIIINSIMLINYSMCVEVGLEHIHVQHVCTTFKGWDKYCVNIILFLSYVRSLLLCIYFFVEMKWKAFVFLPCVCVCVVQRELKGIIMHSSLPDCNLHLTLKQEMANNMIW